MELWGLRWSCEWAGLGTQGTGCKGVMLKSLFINNSVQRPRFWKMSYSNTDMITWKHKHWIVAEAWIFLLLDRLTLCWVFWKEHSGEIWHKGMCLIALTTLESRVKFISVRSGEQEDIVADKAAGCHYKQDFIKSYKPSYPFPKHRAQV